MKRSKNKKITILLLLCLSIGFAYLSANVAINGLLGYGASRWDVHFENIKLVHTLEDSEQPTI